MWEKIYNWHDEEVIFRSDVGGDFRELRFMHDQCWDSRYTSAKDRQTMMNPKSRTKHHLKDDSSAFLTPSNDFDDSKPLETLIHHGDHNLTIPAEYLK